jgi:ubiquinone/menaquinone biosynthesis C-methylase UbiE
MSVLTKALNAGGGLFEALAELQRDGADGNDDRAAVIKSKVLATYDAGASLMAQSPLFWNWGMHREDLHQELRRKIANYDVCGSDGHSEQLYLYVFQCARQDAPAPRRVLEVGCGMGVGLNLLSRLDENSSFVGLDLSQEAIAIATARFSRANSLKFQQGDAEALPFSEGEFDVVFNIESSHNYPNLPKFFAEAVRVLKPGGYLVHADLMTPTFAATLARIRNDMNGSVEWLVDEDITELVRVAIRKRMAPDSYFRREIRNSVPLPGRLLLEPMMMNSFGLPLLQEHYGMMSSWFRARFRAVYPVETYRLTVAKRREVQA